jgi:hypothetical protein
VSLKLEETLPFSGFVEILSCKVTRTPCSLYPLQVLPATVLVLAEDDNLEGKTMVFLHWLLFGAQCAWFTGTLTGVTLPENL